MIIENSKVISNIEIANNIFLLTVRSPQIASHGKAGQFCNIKVSNSNYPLLRRPFSICDINNDEVSFLFNIVGEGTKILSGKKENDVINILGPLGNGFLLNDDFDLAVFVAGGLGIAPFPLLQKELKNKKQIERFFGARTAAEIITLDFEESHWATDDGSLGRRGTVLDLLDSEINNFTNYKLKIFGCGPTPMLKALQKYSEEKKIKCEISVESAMACGFGICQGCPVEKNDKSGFYLICKDGPVFNSSDVIL